MLLYLLSIADEETKPNIVILYSTNIENMTKITVGRLKLAGDENCETDAQDIIQNTFVNTVKYINDIPTTDPKEQKAYLYAILRNETSRFLKKRSDPKAESMPMKRSSYENDFVEKLAMKERYDQVVEAIYRLDEMYSTVLLFRYVFEYSPAKIAQLLGSSRQAVYKRLKTGKALLLKHLKEEGIDGI